MLPKISHPTFDLQVPSTKAKVSFRPMLVKEEKLLLMAKQSNELHEMLSAVRQVVNNCAVSKNFDIDKLTMFDLEFLFVRLRAASINNVTKLSYRDPDDGKRYDVEADFNKMEIKWPEEKVSNIVSVQDDVSIVLRYPPASCYADAEFASTTPDPDYMLLKCIEKIMDGDRAFDPATENLEDLKTWIADLPLDANEKINKFWSSMPTLHYDVKWKNSNGKEQVVTLSTFEDFFPLR